MPLKRDDRFAIAWSDDMCDWIVAKAHNEDIPVTKAVYGTLATAVMLARAIGMQDDAILERLNQILKDEFPEEMLHNTELH